MKTVAGIIAAFALAACQAKSLNRTAPSAAGWEGRIIAQSSCASCHGIAVNATSSPNPDAPPFAAIVNRDGLTRETLSSWLRDAHNYPGEMEFELDPAKVEHLVTYMLTLQDPTYTPSSG